MRFLHQSSLLYLLLGTASLSSAAHSWAFGDATVTVFEKGGGAGALKEKFSPNKPLGKQLSLGASDSLKIVLTTQEDSKPKRPHQAFLHLQDSKSGLETSFPFQVKDNGKGKIDLAQKDIPTQLLSSSEPLSASIIVASFGPSKPYEGKAFELRIDLDPINSPKLEKEKPLRYGNLSEIHHIFKSDPTSPPRIITIIFTAAVVAMLPALFIAWFSLGANLNHLSKAISDAPVPHALFFLSILAMEGIFFMYYTRWNLFQTLPGAAGIGLTTFLSGSRALREVQQRRLSGLR
ncbi:hypothetical protein MMC21_004120 [Puttea exsequens]|nr:hypothetical protein [Puttea exsequens]